MPNATVIPENALTLAELWLLGEAIKAKASRSLSGRLEVDFKAALGHHGEPGKSSVIPSKSGRLRVGDLERSAHSILMRAAPGSGGNAVFVVHYGIGDDAFPVEGVRLSDAMPVVWQLQKELRIPRSRSGGLSTVGVWTPGMNTDEMRAYGGFRKGKDGGGLQLGGALRLAWVLGLDASGRPACALFRTVEQTWFALGTTPIAKPPAAELEQARSAPYRNAILPAELWTLGEQIRKQAARKKPGDYYSEVPTFSKRLRLHFRRDKAASAPSVGGEVCFGDLSDPENAIRIEGGGADNRVFQLGDRFGDPYMHGLRLSNETPVRWETRAPFVPTAPSSMDRKAGRIGFWSPGIERKQPDQFFGTHRYPDVKGVLGWEVKLGRPVNMVVGYDAKGRPACVVADADLDPRVFDHGRAPLGSDAKSAAKTMTAARAKAAAEEAAENPLTPASLAELTALAAAIAAGPTKRRAKVGKRFSLSWTKAAIPTVDGKLQVGDPSGADFEIAAAGETTKPVFIFTDQEYDVDGAVVGLRLGEGKAVQWKPGFGIGVDSGTYGVWSPGFPTEDVAPYGAATEGELAAYVLATADGDCCFPSLLGLDAAKQPVAFLFGEALRPEIFKQATK
jgi:hypothetical protein